MTPENPREGSKTRVVTELTLAVLIGYLGTLSYWGIDNQVFQSTLNRIHQMKQRCGIGGRSLLNPGEEFQDARDALDKFMPRGDLLRMDPVIALRRVKKKVDAFCKGTKEGRESNAK